MAQVKTMGVAKNIEEVNITATNTVTAVKEDAAPKTTGIGAEAVAVEPTVTLHITVGHTECVPNRVKTAGSHQMDTKRIRYGVKICRSVKETAPDRLG